MSDRPKIEWTDEELADALGVARDFTRWAATLRDAFKKLGAVHPHDAREREREAWDGCHEWNRASPGEAHKHKWSGISTTERDERYPSLTPPTPPALTLSHGEYIRRDRKWWRTSGTQAEWLDGLYPHTASDARALAEWLEKWGSTEEKK